MDKKTFHKICHHDERIRHHVLATALPGRARIGGYFVEKYHSFWSAYHSGKKNALQKPGKAYLK